MVHIYNVTTALRMCHASVFSMRDFKQVSEHIQRNAQDNTRQRDSRHVQHTYQDSHIRYTAVIPDSTVCTKSLPYSSSFGYKYDLKS